jgi:hypothetical protein
LTTSAFSIGELSATPWSGKHAAKNKHESELSILKHRRNICNLNTIGKR